MEEIALQLAYGFGSVCKLGLTIFVEKASVLAIKDIVRSEIELCREAQRSGHLSQTE